MSKRRKEWVVLKNILLIHTGGTISMEENKETGAVQETEEHPLTKFKNEYESLANLDELVLFDLPSPQVTPTEMLQLKKEIEKQLNHYDGIVITHGTDTLEETAYFLHLVIQSEKPIILTGSMRSSNEMGSDALPNLINSIRVASTEKAKNKGILVVMNDEIHTAEYVMKTSANNIASFQSPQSGAIGIISKDMIFFQEGLASNEFYPIETISTSVPILKAYTGMNEEIIEAVAATKPDGLVIEAFGQGNLPASLVPALERLINKEIPVVVVSRSFTGIVQPTYAYQGGGRHLQELGVIFAYGLTGQKARLKLMVALETTKDESELRKIFDNTIAH